MKKLDWRTVAPHLKKIKMPFSIRRGVIDHIREHFIGTGKGSRWVEDAVLEKMKREGWSKPDWMSDQEWNEKA